MENVAVIVLLLTALALPVALFLLLRSRYGWNGLFAAAIAVAVGWLFNVAYVLAIQEITPKDASLASGDTLAIAASFGWACPSVLVLLTWLVGRLATRRAKRMTPGSLDENGSARK